jgi:hypothetical protein
VISFAVSAVTKGKQMVPVLNAIGVHCAVVGNHDFGEFVLLFKVVMFQPKFLQAGTILSPL